MREKSSMYAIAEEGWCDSVTEKKRKHGDLTALNLE